VPTQRLGSQIVFISIELEYETKFRVTSITFSIQFLSYSFRAKKNLIYVYFGIFRGMPIQTCSYGLADMFPYMLSKGSRRHRHIVRAYYYTKSS
jgi:hypothetical protein